MASPPAGAGAASPGPAWDPRPDPGGGPDPGGPVLDYELALGGELAVDDELTLDDGTALTIERSARLVAAWADAEARLYQVVGGWVASTAGPDVKIFLESCSQHHAWRARLWEERQRGLPAQFAGTYDELAPVIAGLAGLEGDVGRLSAYCRVVLPRAVVGYRSWLRRCSLSSDQPAARALRMAMADVVADWERGSGLLVSYMGGESGEQAAGFAAAATREIDQLLARVDGWPGC
jgi:hypothetical protein